ncbi:MAG: hypothetical protein KME03_07680 [Aphanocapsa lilacina HA4352-LM1]|jgi:hypothetical protein|nr:hypothetical protein [Aphanocapsa lilacina HA4352-LM1]
MKAASSSLFGGFVLATAASGAILLALTLWNTVQLQILAHRPAPSLVQLSDGQAVQVRAAGHYAREPEVIRRFVAEALGMLFTWRRYIPAAGPGQADSEDPGIVLSNRARVPTSVFQAGFYLSEDLRTELLRQLAELSARTLSGKGGQVLFSATFIGQPQPVAGQEHTWSLSVVGSQVVYSLERPEGVPIPFNKQVTVRAVDPPVVPGELPQTPLEKAVARVRGSGLEIISLRSLAAPEISPEISKEQPR